MRASEIRKAYIDYFVQKAGHTFAPSSPVVPYDDPTLLFTNAGMNQFKDVFLGRGSRPYTRAVNTQKCIRAGGKHNDLEDVGKDVYHHTFFEMLGNWSFGDYFKQDSIAWGWDLLTRVYGLPADRLYATYFGGNPKAGLEPDEEARALWCRFLPPERVLPGNMKDNFWEMGEQGPCGPCSEIHFDRIGGRDAAALVNSGDPDVLEIWNHVFIQFNREPDGSLKPLPAKHVDTGMGLERLVSVIQGKRSNYDTDLWSPIFDAIRSETGARAYAGSLTDHTDIAYRVIADHVRCLTVAACDGAGPGNEGRNYVLRRILRRAARHGRQTLGRKDPFLYRLVPAVAATLGEAFPEIATKWNAAADIIRDEEETFGRTLDRGLALFGEAAERAKAQSPATIAAADAFRLHDTWGFPIDLTQVMAEERGLAVDTAGYERLMEEARETSRRGAGGDEALHFPPDAIAKLATLGVAPTDDGTKYAPKPMTARIRAIWDGREFVQSTGSADCAIVLDRTPFYAESGGQEGDHGSIHGDNDGAFDVRDAQSMGGFVLHIGRAGHGTLRVNDGVTVQVDPHRRSALAQNHTGTHLLNLALREVAGDEVEQRGSLVAQDRLRFDYAARKALTPEQVKQVEDRVRACIDQGLSVHAQVAPLDAARAVQGVRAVFGERYPDPVRVVSIGASVDALLAAPGDAAWRLQSTEFCGGTHVANTAELMDFVLASEGALAAGVRRVFALTGAAAKASRLAAQSLGERCTAAARLDPSALAAEVNEIVRLEGSLGLGASDRAALAPMIEALRERVKESRKANEKVEREQAVAEVRDLVARHPGGPLVARLASGDGQALLAALDCAKASLIDCPVMLLGVDQDAGKVAIVAACPKAWIDKGLKAGEWVKVAAVACGGGGGGKPDVAQAGGKDPSKVDAAIAAASAHAAR
jgi:alanyl-tRNA synthetase